MAPCYAQDAMCFRHLRSLCYLGLLILLLAGCSPAQEGVHSLTILHTNDLHARLNPDQKGRGGFAYLATSIRQEKSKSEGSLVLNAGDLVQGTPVSSIFEGVPCYEIASQMGFDVNTLGNHEFDYGLPKLFEFIKMAGFSTVSANVAGLNGRLLTENAYIVREVNGLRVAVIGAMTEALPGLLKKNQREGWRVLPLVETVREYARRLRDQSDLIVVLGHLLDEEEERLLEEAPEVNLIVSGHNHTGQREVREIDGRLCVRVLAYGFELGRLDLKVDTGNKRIADYRWRRIPITAAYPPDERVAKLVESWEAKVSALVDIPIGIAKRPVARSRLIPMIQEAMEEAVAADLAYINSGGVRDTLPRGEILARHVWNVLPFGNAIVYGWIKGRDLPDRVSQGRRIDPNRDYVLATNDFIGERWESEGVMLSQQGPLVREAFIEWIKTRKVID